MSDTSDLRYKYLNFYRWTLLWVIRVKTNLPWLQVHTGVVDEASQSFEMLC